MSGNRLLFPLGHVFLSSVIVGDLYVVRIALAPREADAVLVIDANAVLPFAIASEPLQSVAGRQRQVAQRSSRVQHLQFPKRGFVKACRNATAAFFVPKSLRLGIPESLNHMSNTIAMGY